METIFINTENSKTNECNKFINQFTDKLNLKNPNNKNIGLVNLSIYYARKNMKSAYNDNTFKEFLIRLGMMNLNCLMDHIQFLTFKITLSLSSKNKKLCLKILPYKFV